MQFRADINDPALANASESNILFELTQTQHEALVQVAEMFSKKPLTPSTKPKITIKEAIVTTPPLKSAFRKDHKDTVAPKTVSFKRVLREGTRRSPRQWKPREVTNVSSFNEAALLKAKSPTTREAKKKNKRRSITANRRKKS